MNTLVKFQDVSLHVKHPARSILENINLTITPNEFVIILGSNGSGKSSFLKLIDRRYHTTQGKIFLAENAIESYSHQALAKFLVTLTQNPLDSLFPQLTVHENAVIALSQNKPSIDSLEKYLADFNPHLPKHFKSLVGSLSGGEQQALALALACLARPRLLLLDEHTSALDPHAADRLMHITAEMVKRYDITCLLTTHNLNIAKDYGTRLIALQQGKIIQDLDIVKKQAMSVEDLRACCY